MYQKRLCLFVLGLSLVLATGASADIVQGKILIEYWFGNGLNSTLNTLTENVDFPDNYASAELLDSFDRPDLANMDYWGARLLGWLTPPESGDYTFWTASDDDSQVWLSTDDTAANKALVCSVTGWGNYQDWTGTSGSMGTNFKSKPITLQAGQKYYVEGLMCDGTGGGQMSVAWAGPGIGDAPTLISGAYLECDNTALNINFIAKTPDPANHAVDVVSPLFGWTAGQDAKTDSIYLGTSPELGAADFQGKQASKNPVFFYPLDLTPGATYYWRVDTTDTSNVVHTGKVWSFTVMPVKATEPSPADGTGWLVFSGQTLTWKAGQNLPVHDVFLGTDKDAVTAADTSSPLYVGQQLVDATFDTGVLQPATTYFWRVDEVDMMGTTFTGDVWSFTTTQANLGLVRREIWKDIGGGTAVSDLTGNPRYAGPADQIDTVTEFRSPDLGIDNYGGRLSALLHVPTAGDYTFWVASDDNSQLWFGATPGKAKIIASVASWTGDMAYDSVAEQKSATMSLEAGTYFLMALWKEGGGGDNCSAGWQGPGLARQVIGGGYCEPFVATWAMSPAPADAAIDVTQTPILSWVPGIKTVTQDIYFGTDAAAVAAADQSSPLFKGEVGVDVKTFDPGPLEWNTTYYWRVDDVNSADAGSPWVGAVWSFRVANFLVIDLSQKSLGYDNTASPFLSELTYAVPADWASHGETALALRFMGATGASDSPGTSTSLDNGVYTIVGAGTDIWNASDQFRFAYMTLQGDGEIQAKVESLENPSASGGWSKAAVMIRQSVAANTVYALESLAGGGAGNGGGTNLQWRDSAGANAANSADGPGVAAPYWLKLVRTGNDFTGFWSPDGVTWTQQAQHTVVMTGQVLIGLAVTSHVDLNTTCKAVFSNVSATGNIDQLSAASYDVKPGNSGQPIFVEVEDKAGNEAVATFSNGAATQITSWTPWEIPLSAFAGVDLANVARLLVGVGDEMSPKADGTGIIYIDSVRVVSALDVTAPGDEVHGIPEAATCGGNSATDVSPCGELPKFVIDNSSATKYLNFKGDFDAGETACGFTVVPSVGATVVIGMTFTSANDSPERDPVAFELDGSNDGGATWTLIANGPIVDFAGVAAYPRLTKTVTPIVFANDVAYTEYQVLFTAIRNAATANSMQIAEVELLGSAQ